MNRRDNAIRCRRHTIGLSLGKDLRQVDFSLSNQVRLPDILRIAGHSHETSTLHLRRALAVRLGRWRGRVDAGDLRELIHILIQLEPDLLVPLRVLTTTLDRLGAPFLTIEDDLTVGVLFSYVPFVG